MACTLGHLKLHTSVVGLSTVRLKNNATFYLISRLQLNIQKSDQESWLDTVCWMDLNFCGIMLLAGIRSLAIRREEEARLAACTNAYPGTLVGKVFLSHDIMEHITSFVVQKEQWWYDSELEDDLSHGGDCTQYITGRKYGKECPPELCRHAQAQARIRKQIEMPLRVIRHVGSGDLINGVRDEIPLRPDTGRTQYGKVPSFPIFALYFDQITFTRLCNL